MNRLPINRLLAGLFVLLALPVLAVSVLIVPTGQGADEVAHILRADSWRRGVLIGHREDSAQPDGRHFAMPGVIADPALMIAAGAVAPNPTAQVTEEALEAAQRQPWGVTTFLQLGPISGYFPIFYTPDAVGLQAARWLRLGPYAAFHAARFVNALAFVLIGSAALLLARRGHALILVTLCLPMTLNLAATASQDGVSIACAALAAALLTRAAAGPDGLAGRISREPAWWAAAALIALLATVKPPYLPLAGALLLPIPSIWAWGRARPELLRRVGGVMLTAILPALWTLLTIHCASGPVPRPPYEAGPLWPGSRPAEFGSTDMAAQLHVLLAAPWRFVTLPLRTFWNDPTMLQAAVGVLGWLDVFLPGWLYKLWYVALIVGGLAALPRGGVPGARALDLLAMLIVIGACFLAIYISQYLVWTDVGQNRIDGPQGRYLLPLLPFIPLGLGLAPGRPDSALGFALALPIIAAAAAGATLLPWIYVAFYYVR